MTDTQIAIFLVVAAVWQLGVVSIMDTENMLSHVVFKFVPILMAVGMLASAAFLQFA